LKFLSDYFKSVVDGTNVLHRSFRYVNSTPRNRKSFIRQFYSLYKHINSDEELTVDSFHELLTLMCSDFPYSLVRNASRITMEVKDFPQKVNFRDFSLKIFILFFFSEFMNQSALSFRTIDKKSTGKVEVSGFLERLRYIVNKSPKFSHPGISVLEEVLNNSAKNKFVMFNEFCVKLFLHPNMAKALESSPSHRDLKATLGEFAQMIHKTAPVPRSNP